MSFQPRFCPHATCPSHSGSPFTFNQCGSYQRECDRKVVPRFKCLVCSHGFSEQTFRVNYRLKRPELLEPLYNDRISKVTHRQSARIHACTRGTEERHFRRISAHCEAFHGLKLSEVVARGGLGEVFSFDELETYEQHRTQKPVTVPILIERVSGFVVDARVGTLPARGKSGDKERRRLEREAESQAEPEGKAEVTPDAASVVSPTDKSDGLRKSESREVVKAALERLRDFCPKERPLRVLTDCKQSYAALLQEIFGERCKHERTSSTRRRDTRNPLWPINHTLARVRDNISRLVRETWAAAKKRCWLAGHLAIWTCYRNYIRGRTNREPEKTPAMVLGVQEVQWQVEKLLEWRVFPKR